MKSRHAPKARKLRNHPTGISAPCKNGKHSQCTMLECQDDCHESMDLTGESIEAPIDYFARS